MTYIQKLINTASFQRLRFFFSPTAFTEEDIYAARRIAVDHDFLDIVFLTSEFHLPRVKLIAKHVFRDRRIRFVSATNASDIRDEWLEHERKESQKFLSKWVDAPLYCQKNDPFPAPIYQNAWEQHKHSDTISLSVVTASFIVAAFPQTKITHATIDYGTYCTLLTCSVISLLLFAIYWRFAVFAFIARRVMRSMELSWGLSGFSYNNDRFVHIKWRLPKTLGTARLLGFIVLILVGLNVTLAVSYLLGLIRHI